MDIQELVSRGWQDHAGDAEGVLARLPEGLPLVGQAQEAGALAALVVHVAGEHLGRWDEGLALLDRLLELPCCAQDAPARASLQRSKAVLHHCAGRIEESEACLRGGIDTAHPPGSSVARVQAIAASALAGQGRLDEALVAFETARGLLASGLEPDDPAVRALAVTGNNLACELEGRAGRTEEESRLLRLAAATARHCWELAGTWLNVARAEYRLAKTCLALGEAEEARRHAELALETCEAHEAEASERFFAHEAIALSFLASSDSAGAQAARDRAAALLAEIADEDARSWCAAELDELDAALARPEPRPGSD